MATLRQRKERGNRWMLTYVDIDKSVYRVDTGTTDKKVANLWLKKVEELLSQAKLGLTPKIGRIDSDVFSGKKKASSITLSAFKEKYLDRCEHDLNLAKNTISMNRLAFDSLIAITGDKPTDTLSDEDIVKWKKAQDNKGNTKTTTGIYFRHLRAAFNRAIKWGDAPANPFLLVAEPKEKRKKTTSKDITDEHVHTLLTGIENAGDIQFLRFVQFALYTGCRRNEVLHLVWEDIDLERKAVRVYAEKSKQELELPISDILFEVILRMEPQEEGYVFPTHTSARGVKKGEQPWSSSYVTHRFKKYVRELGLPEWYSLHSLRHTFTTQLRRQGVPLDIIYRLLGHSSPRVTEENYDHSVALHFRKQINLAGFQVSSSNSHLKTDNNGSNAA